MSIIGKLRSECAKAYQTQLIFGSYFASRTFGHTFCFDTFSVQLVQAVGFEVVGITGSGLAQNLLGFPDVGWVWVGCFQSQTVLFAYIETMVG